MMGVKTLKMRQEALGISPDALKEANCPECNSKKLNCLYSAMDDQFDIICCDCSYSCSGTCFSSAMASFDWRGQLANSDSDSVLILEVDNG